MGITICACSKETILFWSCPWPPTRRVTAAPTASPASTTTVGSQTRIRGLPPRPASRESFTELLPNRGLHQSRLAKAGPFSWEVRVCNGLSEPVALHHPILDGPLLPLRLDLGRYPVLALRRKCGRVAVDDLEQPRVPHPMKAIGGRP